jgi:cytochrome c551/c552
MGSLTPAIRNYRLSANFAGTRIFAIFPDLIHLDHCDRLDGILEFSNVSVSQCRPARNIKGVIDAELVIRSRCCLRGLGVGGVGTDARRGPGGSTLESGLLDQYCVGCHNDRLKSGGLALNKIDVTKPAENAETWEKVIRKLRSGLMPPAGARRPAATQLNAFAASLETSIDQVASARPNPGKPSLHRLNRAEYQNTVRDLLALDVDATSLLPADDTSVGFDNIADVLNVSPALLEGYARAASKISPRGGGRSEYHAVRRDLSYSAGSSSAEARGRRALRHPRRAGL